MTKSEYGRRYALLAVALFLNAMGIALITKALLGTSPISSLPYVFSLFTPLSFGTYTFILNVLFVLVEVVLLGREAFTSKRFEIGVQIPILIFFSASTDVCMFLLGWLHPCSYVVQLLCLVFGCAVLATGIGWAVKAGVAMNPGEYVVRVIADKMDKNFGTVKLYFDVTLMLLACAVSLIFMHTINGIREGTLISALLVGPMEKFMYPWWKGLDRLL